MTNTLIPAEYNLPSNPHDNDETFKSLVKSAGFPPRLQLFGGNSDMVKEGKIPIAHYGLVTGKDDIKDLGDEVDLIPVRMRFKAVRIGGEEGAVNYFDPKSEEFKKIVSDSETQNSGCMYGPEFLVWLPDDQKFATYFLNSASARREAPALRGLINQAATLKAKLVKTKKYKWHAPQVVACSTPLDAPSEAELIEEVTRFVNPKDSGADAASADEVAATDRAV
jgi:hypothetical protein